MVIDLSLNNAELYAGCNITEVGGRLTLVTPVAEAVNVVGRNAQAMVDAYDQRAAARAGEGGQLLARSGVTLTGAMAVWAYLVVFHVIVHRFGEVWYDDGRGNRVLIAKH